MNSNTNQTVWCPCPSGYWRSCYRVWTADRQIQPKICTQYENTRVHFLQGESYGNADIADFYALLEKNKKHKEEKDENCWTCVTSYSIGDWTVYDNLSQIRRSDPVHCGMKFIFLMVDGKVPSTDIVEWNLRIWFLSDTNIKGIRVFKTDLKIYLVRYCTKCALLIKYGYTIRSWL